MGFPLDGGSNEKKFKKSCALHPWGFVVESARRYKCGQVHSAQEYIMYLDTDALIWKHIMLVLRMFSNWGRHSCEISARTNYIYKYFYSRPGQENKCRLHKNNNKTDNK